MTGMDDSPRPGRTFADDMETAARALLDGSPRPVDDDEIAAALAAMLRDAANASRAGRTVPTAALKFARRVADAVVVTAASQRLGVPAPRPAVRRG